jgi:hypothetical protein
VREQEPGPPAKIAPVGRTVAVAAGVVAQALVLVFLYLPSGLLVPGLAWGVIVAIGVAFGAAAVVLARRRSLAVLAVPVVSALTWVAFVSAGEAIFGWTA